MNEQIEDRIPAGFELHDLGSFNEIEIMLLKLTKQRLDAFRARFGRNPVPGEPPFFDPESDEPVWARPSEIRRQITEAAGAIAPDRRPLLRCFGLDLH